MARVILAVLLLVVATLTPGGQASSLRSRRIHARNQPPVDSFRKNFGWPGFSFPNDRWGVVMDSPEVEEAAVKAASATIVSPNLGTAPVNVAPSPYSTPLFSSLSIISTVPQATASTSAAGLADISNLNITSSANPSSVTSSTPEPTSQSVTPLVVESSSVPASRSVAPSSSSIPTSTQSQVPVSSPTSQSSVRLVSSSSPVRSLSSPASSPSPPASSHSPPASSPSPPASSPSPPASSHPSPAPPVSSHSSSPTTSSHSQAPQTPQPSQSGVINVGTAPEGSSSNQGNDQNQASDSNASSGSTSGPTSPSDIAAYLAGHNTVRAQHGAAPLTYSQSLAAKAQQWADGCVFQHSGGTLGPFGENLAAGTGSGYGISQAIGSWTAEVSQYNPQSPVASHFTQVVWKSTTEVGCALQNCAGIFASSFGLAHYYVCEYSPQGNVIGEFAANVQV